jgi:hypothetical protein
MRFPLRWIFLIVGGVTLWRAGISIFSAPDHEVLYAASQPVHTCVPQTCVTMLTLEVGNTGEEIQPNVRIRLKAAPLRQLQLPVKVLNFGKVARPVKMQESADERVYDLGALEPQKRVELQATFLSPPGQRGPAWDEILVAVEPSAGEAKVGNPGALLFARWMHAFFGWL